MNEPQLPAELEKRFDEEISYLLHEMVDGDWCPAFGIPYFNPLESTSATKTKPNYRVVNLVNKCECSGAEKIAKIKHFLATALEEQTIEYVRRVEGMKLDHTPYNHRIDAYNDAIDDVLELLTQKKEDTHAE